MNRFGVLLSSWEQRSPRERVLLGVCLVLIVGTLIWLLVVRPLQAWREDQADILTAARAEEDAVMRALASTSKQDPGATSDIQAVVAQTSAAAGLQPVLGMGQRGDLGFSLTGVSAGPALSWLADLEGRGITTRSISIVKNADATVSIEGSLAGG